MSYIELCKFAEKMSIIYTSTTHNVTVLVTPTFVEPDSDPTNHVYLWAYSVTIQNQRLDQITLRSRFWHITDGKGRVEEVSGIGVVGEQSMIMPGEQFNYSSGCPLNTPSGIMTGHYTMMTGSGEALKIEIPTFSLDLPNTSRLLN